MWGYIRAVVGIPRLCFDVTPPPNSLVFNACKASFEQSPSILVRTIWCWTALGMLGILISIQTTYASLPCCLAASPPSFACSGSSVDFQPWNGLHRRLSGAQVGIPMHLGQDGTSRKGVRCHPPPLDDAACARVAGPHLCTPPVHPAGTDVPSAAVGSCCLPESESSPSRG